LVNPATAPRKEGEAAAGGGKGGGTVYDPIRSVFVGNLDFKVCLRLLFSWPVFWALGGVCAAQAAATSHQLPLKPHNPAGQAAPRNITATKPP